METLLRVKLEDVTGVDEIFTILMGDEVEPRRNFIQQHALEVRNWTYDYYSEGATGVTVEDAQNGHPARPQAMSIAEA